MSSTVGNPRHRRAQERVQNVSLPSYNKVPLASSQYGADRAVTQDLS